MIRVSLLLLAATLPATAAHAQRDPYAYTMHAVDGEERPDPMVERRYTPQLAACQKRAKVTHEIAACFDAEFHRQDAVLNRVWRTVFARIPAAKHPPLLAAQRKWIAERDPYCRRMYDSYQGGTLAPVAYSNCQAELTIRRTMWLERLR